MAITIIDSFPQIQALCSVPHFDRDLWNAYIDSLSPPFASGWKPVWSALWPPAFPGRNSIFPPSRQPERLPNGGRPSTAFS